MSNSVREIELAMHAHWPECADQHSFTLLKTASIQTLFKNAIDTSAAEYELQQADFSVLVTLRRCPPPYCLSPTDLYKSMFFSSGGLTKVLKRLVEADLIERLGNPKDKRCKLVKLNHKGKKLIETIMPKLNEKNKTLLQGLSEVEQKQLNALMQKVFDPHEGA